MGSTEIILIISAFVTSCISGAIGMAGGMILLTIMLPFFPPTVLIPLHGSVQLVSNGFRLAINFKALDKSIFILAFLGSFIGAFFAEKVIWSVQGEYYQLLLAVFIITITWMPKLRNSWNFKGRFFVLGGFSSFASIVFGITGPLLAPFFLSEKLKPQQIVATKASIQFVGHILKLSIYAYSGFVFQKYFYILIPMIIAVILGTLVGKKLLFKMNEKLFKTIFKWVITTIASYILLKTIFDLMRF